MTSPADNLIIASPRISSSDAADSEDPYRSVEDVSQAIRDQLTLRINTHTHPSRLINQIGLADLRCANSAQVLARLVSRAPKVLKVIRAELRKTFGIDPDSLLFTEPKPPQVPLKVDSLTDRALLLLVLPTVPVNINQFTALSVKGASAHPLSYTPLEAMQRVIAMKLFDRLAHAATEYWGTLVQGSWLTRRERWVELYKELLADRAFMARQLDEVSSTGMAMVQALIDAPTAEARERSGGDWASVRACPLMWPGAVSVPIPGALHIYREGDPSDAPHVIYIPGLVRSFYEYSSFMLLQCGLLKLASESLFDDLWQCMPLKRRHELCRPTNMTSASSVLRGSMVTDDALAFSAQALLDGQWENELACAIAINHAHVFSSERPRPPALAAVPFLAYIERARKQLVGGARLGVIRDELLQWDQQRRRAEIIFASTAPGLALLTVEHQVKRYEKALVALLNPLDPGEDTQGYRDLVVLVNQLKVHAQALNTLTQGAQQRLFELAFWIERPTGTRRRGFLVVHAQTEALRCEVQLLHRLKLIRTAHRDLIIEVLDQPLAAKRSDSTTQVLSISVGSEPDAFYPLHNVWVVTRAEAVKSAARQVPVVLCAFGQKGGVTTFSGLDALTRSLKVSLNSRDDSVLWGCVERDKRHDLRAHAARETLAVRYELVEGNPALLSLKQLLKCYVRLKKSIDGNDARLFSEVTDVELSRLLLVGELDEHLKVPASDALKQALANIDLLRSAASEAKKLPAWLPRATVVQRKHFMQLQRHYVSSAVVFESRLKQRLPELDTFARRILIARLSQDGFYPQLDIDKPLIEMPDAVASHQSGWDSTSSIGDRQVIHTPTLERTTFSMLHLALHNLDPKDASTKRRFNYARYLQPDWKKRLNSSYLINMVSSLDIGGQYEALINKVFYPHVATAHTLSEGRIPALLNRTLQAGVSGHLFSAVQQGLTANAQSVFTTAMTARTPEDLLRNGHQLQLCVVHLVGHTMRNDRYIAGIVVIHDKHSERCVVYWPSAPGTFVLCEYSSLQQAHAELNRIGALPDNFKALVQQIAPGWAFEAITHHPDKVDAPIWPIKILDTRSVSFMLKGIWKGAEFVRSFSIKHLEPTALPDEIEKQTREQMASDPLSWLAVVPTSHSNAKALLYRAYVLDVQRRTQAACNSGKALEKYRLRREEEQSDTRIRALVSFFVPPIGMANAFYELLLAARRYHRFGSPHDAVDVGFMTVFLVIDLLTSFIPGSKGKGVAGVGIVRRPLGTALNRIRRLSMKTHGGFSRQTPSPVTQLKPLQPFKIKGVPEGAVALKGPGERGIHVKSGEHFVVDDAHYYPVYRRSKEQPFRLKNKQVPGQDELILDIHQGKEWLLGADAPQPIPGPSSGVLSPWRTPALSSDWRPPTVRMGTESRIFQSSVSGTDWFSWRSQTPGNQISGPSVLGVSRVHLESPGFPYDAIYVGSWYDTATESGAGHYRLLYQGDQAPLNKIAFIYRDEPLVSLASVDIERWTNTATGRRDQPIPVSRGPTGDWQLHAPLFGRPLEQSVGMAFPSMTTHSRRFLVLRLIELSDSSRPVTASHLLNVRATLDNWLPPVPSRLGQTDDVLQMLRPAKMKQNVFVGYEGKAPGFTRVDFTPSVALDPVLKSGGTRVKAARNIAQRAQVRTVLEQQGFNCQELQVKRGRVLAHELIATHPNSNKLYYVSYHWIEYGSIMLGRRFTDHWLNSSINKYPLSLPLAGVRSAMQEQRLTRIVAGIHWPKRGTLPATVYFVKVSPLEP
ncbi:DUF6543 domain-containing protein [Pseudomonas sp. ADAK18]|uniref:dermonecrotic toxin domain-containing protein n=1 Tax=Pseudomonas sp. ADAK18 TaxID=2730848 RepID=UPI001F19C6E1|nr:DUF6543 domain-containing protein [Pseudomonas sp. ADAK18]